MSRVLCIGRVVKGKLIFQTEHVRIVKVLPGKEK